MATNYYAPGDWNALCDRCGFKFKASMLRTEWQGYMTCPTCWESKHPSLMQMVPNELPGIPWSRPEPPDVFINAIPPITATFAAAVNLSGMEWAAPGVRYGRSTYPNINYTVPRLEDMQYLASTGVTIARLPIAWEYLQPTRLSTPIIAASVLAGYTSTLQPTYNKGDFWEVYAQYIDKALDDAATAGIKLTLDIHNYCHYKDFVYQTDGTVVGFTVPADKAFPPYTSDASRVVSAIFAKNGSTGNVSSTTTLPYTVATFTAGPTYTLASGDATSNFAISGNTLRMVNSTGINWSVPTIRALTVNGSDSSSYSFQITIGDGPTLTQSDFTDLWTKMVNRWKSKPGLGGYSVMNEPNNLPAVGKNWGINSYPPGYPSPDFTQDYTVWPTYAQTVVNAIRAVDSATAIYVGGNNWQNPIEWPTINPGFPLTGTNIIYDFHLYLDASNSGHRFDWDDELARGFSAGETGGALISSATGTHRIQYILDWAAANGNPVLACTEFGFPIEATSAGGPVDARWLAAGDATLATLKANKIRTFSWMGGNHWAIHSFPINHTPKFYQGSTVEPIVGTYMKKQLPLPGVTYFDQGVNYSLSSAITITVTARGYLASPTTLSVATTSGSLSKSTLNFAAGVNSTDTYTITPAANTVATITYSGASQVPPARKVYSYTNPVALAGSNLPDAAATIMAKYNAGCWLAKDSVKDYLAPNIAPASAGDNVRGIKNSGFGGTVDTPFEMINWLNQESGSNRGVEGPSPLGTGSTGKTALDQSIYGKRGLMSKHLIPVSDGGNTANDDYKYPASPMPFNLTDTHFMVSCFEVVAGGEFGFMMGAGYTGGPQSSSLGVIGGNLQLSQTDQNWTSYNISNAAALATNTITTASFVSASGAQRLRQNGTQVATGTATPVASGFDIATIGFGYWNFVPSDGIQGYTYGWIMGAGAITDPELTVLENYLHSFT